MEGLYPKKVKMLTINPLDRSTLVEAPRMTQDFIQAMETCVRDAFVGQEKIEKEKGMIRVPSWTNVLGRIRKESGASTLALGIFSWK